MNAQTDMTIDQVMALAAQHQAAGQLQQSEHLLQQILQEQPAHAYALHLLGVIAHQCGKPELAIELIGKAISINEKVALFHANRGEMCRQLKQLGEAIQHGERAVALDANMPSAQSNLGIAYFDKEDYAAAEICQKSALALQPTFPAALNNMGSIFSERKQFDDAADYYRRAIAADPHYAEPLNNLGTVLNEKQQHEEAMTLFTRALEVNSQYSDAMCNKGFAYNGMENYDAALACFTQALQMRPDYPEAFLGLARICQEKEQLPEAEKHALHSIELAPEKPEGYSMLATIYMHMNHHQQAEENFEQALNIDPQLVSAMLGKGNLYMAEGRLTDAEALFNQTLLTKPNDLGARFHLSQVKKVQIGDENMRALIAASDKLDEISERKATQLHYALGKCYDDIGDPDNAFPHFLEGARLKRKQITYEPAANTTLFDEVISVFDAAMIERLSGHGCDDALPLFVLGMPRSGTTLTEQIITSHPDVHGGGELHELLSIAHSQTGSNSNEFPSNLKGLKAEHISAWGKKYISQLREYAPAARRITDKMPTNFLMLGLIHLMLPNAKIIHISRHPLDTCLSCFTRLFNKGQEQTYDLAELGRYYVNYTRIMAHWKEVLPKNTFLDVRYEALVTDNEAQARRLIEFCGLEWNEACLQSHKTKRPILTASVTQVREPIYTSSLERWRPYESYLKPLIDELGNFI